MLAQLADSGDGRTALNAALFALPDQSAKARVQQAVDGHLTKLGAPSEGNQGTWRYNLGCPALYQEDLPTAKLRFSEATRQDPTLVSAQHNLGYVNELTTEIEPARAAYRNALDLEPATNWGHPRPWPW